MCMPQPEQTPSPQDAAAQSQRSCSTRTRGERCTVLPASFTDTFSPRTSSDAPDPQRLLACADEMLHTSSRRIGIAHATVRASATTTTTINNNDAHDDNDHVVAVQGCDTRTCRRATIGFRQCLGTALFCISTAQSKVGGCRPSLLPELAQRVGGPRDSGRATHHAPPCVSKRHRRAQKSRGARPRQGEASSDTGHSRTAAGSGHHPCTSAVWRSHWS